jgi:hypothetical protein
MSDKAEEFAKQLLEKTESGKLHWHFVAGDVSEDYRADLEDGFSFWIKRRADGDDKVISFILTRPEGPVLSTVVDNLIAGRARISEDYGTPASPSRFHSVNRFRLFSDLFHAAKKSAVVEDQTIEKVEKLLERLA